MPSCELCGRNMKGQGREMTIEGVSLIVCPQCAERFRSAESTTEGKGSVPSAKRRPYWAGGEDSTRMTANRRPPPTTIPRERKRPVSSRAGIDDMMLVEDFADLIRSARQTKGVTQEDLAQKVGERVSTLQAIETGRLKPTGKTTRGLERELGISLLESAGAAPIKTSKDTSFGGPTLGDVVRVKRKRSQKASE